MLNKPNAEVSLNHGDTTSTTSGSKLMRIREHTWLMISHLKLQASLQCWSNHETARFQLDVCHETDHSRIRFMNRMQIDPPYLVVYALENHMRTIGKSSDFQRDSALTQPWDPDPRDALEPLLLLSIHRPRSTENGWLSERLPLADFLGPWTLGWDFSGFQPRTWSQKESDATRPVLPFLLIQQRIISFKVKYLEKQPQNDSLTDTVSY